VPPQQCVALPLPPPGGSKNTFLAASGAKEKKYEACHLWSQVDFCQKIGETKFKIEITPEKRYEFITTTDDADEEGAAACKSWFDAVERTVIAHLMNQGRPKSYPDPVGWQYRLVRTPGYSSAVIGDPGIVGKPRNPNDLDAYNGMAPLHYAVRQESASVNVVKALLDRGADPNVEDAEGRSAMYFAERNENKETLRLLERSGGTRSQLAENEQRGELFGGVEEAAELTEKRRDAEKLAEEEKEAEKAAKAAEKARKAQSEMEGAMNALVERGEKIQKIDEKTQELQAEAKNFRDMASQLKEMTEKKNKKWFPF